MAWDVAGWRVPTVVSSWVMRPGRGVVVLTLNLSRKAYGRRATLLQAGSHGCGVMDEGGGRFWDGGQWRRWVTRAEEQRGADGGGGSVTGLSRGTVTYSYVNSCVQAWP